mgnify:CR=1 FL=1
MNKARQLTDERILELARKGRLREACGMLAEAYGSELVGTCVSRLGDVTLAQDAAQDSLARARLVGLIEVGRRDGEDMPLSDPAVDAVVRWRRCELPWPASKEWIELFNCNI